MIALFKAILSDKSNGEAPAITRIRATRSALDSLPTGDSVRLLGDTFFGFLLRIDNR